MAKGVKSIYILYLGKSMCKKKILWWKYSSTHLIKLKKERTGLEIYLSKKWKLYLKKKIAINETMKLYICWSFCLNEEAVTEW